MRLEEETGKGHGTVARALFTNTIRRHSFRRSDVLHGGWMWRPYVCHWQACPRSLPRMAQTMPLAYHGR